MSVASISSEIADSDVLLMNKSFKMEFSMIEDATDLDDIQPPSCMDDVSGVLSSITLIADNVNPRRGSNLKTKGKLWQKVTHSNCGCR